MWPFSLTGCDIMHKGNDPPEKRPSAIRLVDALRLLTFGWYFAISLGLGVAGGIALDRWLNTKPGFLLGGLVLGSIAGFYGMFKMLRPLYRARGDSTDHEGDPD